MEELIVCSKKAYDFYKVLQKTVSLIRPIPLLGVQEIIRQDFTDYDFGLRI